MSFEQPTSSLHSLIPRPPLTAFAIVEKCCIFFHGCEKSFQGRPGYEASLSTHLQQPWLILENKLQIETAICQRLVIFHTFSSSIVMQVNCYVCDWLARDPSHPTQVMISLHPLLLAHYTLHLAVLLPSIGIVIHQTI